MSLFGMGEVAKPIAAIGNVFDQLFTSDEERASAEAVMEKIRQHPHILQAEINKIEASHRSVWVAGWRPAIGWVCAISLSFPFLINPILQWSTGMPGPELPIEAMISLVMSLLGLGGLRTFEKLKRLTK